MTFTETLPKLYKMASMWVAAAVSIAASFYLAQPPEVQQALLATLPFPPAVLPFLGGLIPILIARAIPQNLKA